MADRDRRNLIAYRIAQELKDGDVVNLGIGLPTLVCAFIPPGIDITLQSENGFIGLGPPPAKGEEDPEIVNAGGQPVTILPGGAFFDSAESFAIIRGGHVDVTVLGALEVDAYGNLASWMVPGKMVPGMGGAMDLVVGAKKVIVATLHTTRTGESKLRRECQLPLTAANQVDLVVTDMGVFQVNNGSMILLEKNPEFSVEQIRAATEAPLEISTQLKDMEIPA
ncbi:MAG: CoA transferase subunit B [Firmicutes bacterium]|jgi:acetate CoA/acetoacetate CoA-transferase beta subunit|nr:3-oxoacid CoA-transferase subunit B [Bacillota bacterium]NLO66321.1 CoA transferase subunit B [Bacillota bacterium]